MNNEEMIESRKELAEILRKRQQNLTRSEILKATQPMAKKGFTKAERIKAYSEELEALSDDEIIMSYVTCSRCGEKFCSLEEVDEILKDGCKDFDEFMRKVLERSPTHH
ncbi:MAG: hypothetical protein GWO20_15520 [Candidatus Korarchaeota archaeon]|nr:hypothetical protein [Candidatus Korarchaeota archaeon]NIU82630.1 hypothetical protein [Candidatus Thorarchaeota archaeon]NIW13112.1 hypothetical protein [Candidatus Thorarchaeota archaeon]NIW51278.1 hypothetical protein [Candidatus Korarchaeota archaeon]